MRTNFASNLVHDLQTPLIRAVETINGLARGDFGAVTAEQQQAFEIMCRSHIAGIHQLQTKANQYLVRIIDRGRGIEPEDLPRIFIKFYQGEISRRSKGAGLRLYLVQQIIEIHGGTIQVEPIVAKGVTFLFTLPKVASEA